MDEMLFRNPAPDASPVVAPTGKWATFILSPSDFAQAMRVLTTPAKPNSAMLAAAELHKRMTAQ